MQADETLIFFVAEVRAQGFRLTLRGLSAVARMYEGSPPYETPSRALEHGAEVLQERFSGETAWLQPWFCLDDGSYPEGARDAWEAAGIEIPADLETRKVIPAHRTLDALAVFVRRQGEEA